MNEVWLMRSIMCCTVKVMAYPILRIDVDAYLTNRRIYGHNGSVTTVVGHSQYRPR